jgi:hypothetical protein
MPCLSTFAIALKIGTTSNLLASVVPVSVGHSRRSQEQTRNCSFGFCLPLYERSIDEVELLVKMTIDIIVSLVVVLGVCWCTMWVSKRRNCEWSKRRSPESSGATSLLRLPMYLLRAYILYILDTYLPTVWRYLCSSSLAIQPLGTCRAYMKRLILAFDSRA